MRIIVVTEEADEPAPERGHHLPSPGTPLGAVLYAMIASVLIWGAGEVVSHLVITWR